jgi:hypothetical protein
MENTTKVIDCIEFKDELHKKLYKESGANNFNEYIKYINAIYSDNRSNSVKNKGRDKNDRRNTYNGSRL